MGNTKSMSKTKKFMDDLDAVPSSAVDSLLSQVSEVTITSAK
ncbi:hypothetical protein [Actinomyces vulturis]|nr:hypothetical protein [Actinomyces vulturis]